jgi:hypothetical protein
MQTLDACRHPARGDAGDLRHVAVHRPVGQVRLVRREIGGGDSSSSASRAANSGITWFASSADIAAVAPGWVR